MIVWHFIIIMKSYNEFMKILKWFQSANCFQANWALTQLFKLDNTCISIISIKLLMVSFRSLFEKCIQEHSVYKQKGEDTLSNISFRHFTKHQFNAYFITFNLISWNSYRICKKETSTNYYKKKWIQKRIECSICYDRIHIFIRKT